MKSFIRSSIASAIAATLALGATPSHAELDAAGTARLELLRRVPESAGALIYRGTVFAQRAPSATPLFTYERRAGAMTNGLSAAHITSDPDGDVIIAEQARFTTDYELQRFDAANKQMGYSGSVVLSNAGRHLEYQLSENGRVSTAQEDVSDPVVAGPSLHGFILHHWQTLAQGQSIPVRMIVMTKKQTYGFDIRQSAQTGGRTSFSITPSSLLVRLAVAPLTVTFDSATKNVVRYEGRVPPMMVRGGKLEELDARVDYEMQVPVYR
jgi:hypothetical protein